MTQSVEKGSSLSAKLLFILAIIMASACADGTTKAPDDLVPEEAFVQVVVEMNLVEAIKSIQQTKEQNTEALPEEFYAQIWKDHGISEDQFIRSFEYYQSDLEKISRIYSQASEYLKRIEDDVTQQKKDAKAKAYEAGEEYQGDLKPVE